MKANTIATFVRISEITHLSGSPLFEVESSANGKRGILEHTVSLFLLELLFIHMHRRKDFSVPKSTPSILTTKQRSFFLTHATFFCYTKEHTIRTKIVTLTLKIKC